MERDQEDRGREPVEERAGARAADGEVWAAIAPEQAREATVFVRTAAQLPRIKSGYPVIRFSAPSVVLRWHGNKFF